MMDTLGWIILSIVERLSSFREKCMIATIQLEREVSFIQSVLYQRFHCIIYLAMIYRGRPTN